MSIPAGFLRERGFTERIIMRIAQLTLIGILTATFVMADNDALPVREAAQQPLFKEGRAQRPSKTVKLRREELSSGNASCECEIFTGITIPPGQTMNFGGNLDWTGAENAAIAVACPASTSLQNTQVVVYWQMSAFTSTYTATNILAGSNFAYKNMGGATVPVFGNYFGIQIKNVGLTTVVCDQLTVYGVLR